MKDMEITFSAETIREMICHALHNPQLKIEVKRAVWSNVCVKLQMK
jgi:hypothetical protein